MYSDRYIALIYNIYNIHVFNYLYHCYFGSQCYKVFGQKFLFIEKVQAFLDLFLSWALVLKRLCIILFQWLFLDQISFKTKQKSKYIVDFNYIFISIENILNFIEKIWDPIKTLQHTRYNVLLILLYSTMSTV